VVSAPAPIADRTTAVVAEPRSNSAEGNPRRDDDPADRSTSAAVTTRRLGKRYGDFDALIDLSLEVARGEVFGLLGPNGAGKTTFLRTLLGFVRRTSGEAEVLGIDPESDGVGVRRQVAYLPGDARLPRHLRGRSVLKFFADIRPDGDFDMAMGIAERLELDLRRHVGLMSTGMRQKLAIAAVVATHSPILILDEPTAIRRSVRGCSIW
jgi:ABC-2 type transport system ATP-binding protein